MIHQHLMRVAYLLAALNIGLLSAGCGSDSGRNAAETSGGSASQAAQTGGTTSSGPGTSGGSGATTGGSNSNMVATSCVEGESNCFSFFVTSRARLFGLAQAFNGSTKGWGGDLRYGTGNGLTGADKICSEIAEQSLPGNGHSWKAFLSTSSVNAISRVGSGPWYDRLNRIIANNLTELTATRPGGITSATILNNLPNEDGTPHHSEEAGCTDVNSCADNHDIMTGSDSNGKVCTSSTCGGGMGGGGGSITDYTCQDWTLGTAQSGIAPRVGHTWPTGGGMGNGSSGTSDDWISKLTEGGCAAGYNLKETGGTNADGTGSVGAGGGYGAFYCLASN